VAYKLAIENEHITADVVEVSEFIDMAQRYRVQGVPKTVVNERFEMVGAVPEPRFMQQVFEALDKGGKEHSKPSEACYVCDEDRSFFDYCVSFVGEILFCKVTTSFFEV
jgi:Thioredoxin domain